MPCRKSTAAVGRNNRHVCGSICTPPLRPQDLMIAYAQLWFIARRPFRRMWLAKRRVFRMKTQKQQARELLMRVTKSIRRQCFVALVRNKNACRKEYATASVLIQSWLRRGRREAQ